ncbi:MAG: exo-alpha-sialidase [Lentisphaeria bacterium]|nr:exo-alpha-sialidase [Lentisphaeria bacterium]
MDDRVAGILRSEAQRTQPDYLVYMPGSLDGTTHDTGNEHFLVFDGPDGSLMAVWTQSHHEGYGDHRIVFSRSEDEGGSWSPPLRLAGPAVKGEGYQASWGFPMVTASGRIYVLWNQHRGLVDFHHQMTGTMDGRFSDDGGRTWSSPQTVPMPRGPYDHPEPQYPGNWIVWQKPERLSRGKYYVGYTRWLSPRVRRPLATDGAGKPIWWSAESVVEFMRFENLDSDPEPKDILLGFSAWGDRALRVPFYLDPLNSVAQEPSLTPLPDGRLFCTMRTVTGYIWYSLSGDAGETWCNPRPLLRRDHGPVIEEPICCCPIYRLHDGRYVLLHHLRRDGLRYEDSAHNRWPAYLAVGEFRAHADQPVWFSASRQFMTHDGVGIGPTSRTDLGVYPSMTSRGGQDILWHPDRKFFLVGKRITPEWLAGLSVPPGPGAPPACSRTEIR